ncbi:MAG: glutaminyl-tRNA synthase (glutamine-hydrolyzing) subunit B [Omnitrophica WOR_2 bacterium RIFCSPLOWO2_12_FULL_63_16]|nr:MAG: glutaminyl-tRNA synthase (glutamine-hydrolyzing) subunit B [Omnitrophica WOR_2 bacterium RIFCSPLOWO2_12_FULL_63_16]
MAYEPVIGLEVHVQLATASKLFCGCPAAFGASPNSQTCPVCLGLPGTLPVLNQRAFEWGVKVALAFDCQLACVMKFDRKHYFYPDLPKGFQISQYDQPLSQHGHLDIALGPSTKRIGITRIHMEEDAGKLLHDPVQPASYVDFNRAGVPLLEIVSDPDVRSPEEAYQYLLDLKAVLGYLKVSTCNMEEGSLRCDANISLRQVGTTAFGAKIEIKNLNSFKAVKAALDHEVHRQTSLLQQGGTLAQQTRLWDAKAEATELMRTKEEASDYRYFPEPDLVPFVIDQALVERIRRELPELPAQRCARLAKAYGVSPYDAQVLTQHPSLAELFEGALRLYPHPKPVANWVMGEFLGYLNANGKEPDEVQLRPEWLAHLLEAIDKGTISGTMAKELFVDVLAHQRDPNVLIEERGLRQIVDEAALNQLAEAVIAGHPESVKDYQKGKANALMYLVGQCMRHSDGKANPRQVTEVLKKKLETA